VISAGGIQSPGEYPVSPQGRNLSGKSIHAFGALASDVAYQRPGRRMGMADDGGSYDEAALLNPINIRFLCWRMNVSTDLDVFMVGSAIPRANWEN
jgi:hypothetical protein